MAGSLPHLAGKFEARNPRHSREEEAPLIGLTQGAEAVRTERQTAPFRYRYTITTPTCPAVVEGREEEDVGGNDP